MGPLYGLLLTKVEGFVLIKKNREGVEPQLFGQCGHLALLYQWQLSGTSLHSSSRSTSSLAGCLLPGSRST